MPPGDQSCLCCFFFVILPGGHRGAHKTLGGGTQAATLSLRFLFLFFPRSLPCVSAGVLPGSLQTVISGLLCDQSSARVKLPPARL